MIAANYIVANGEPQPTDSSVNAKMRTVEKQMPGRIVKIEIHCVEKATPPVDAALMDQTMGGIEDGILLF